MVILFFFLPAPPDMGDVMDIGEVTDIGDVIGDNMLFYYDKMS